MTLLLLVVSVTPNAPEAPPAPYLSLNPNGPQNVNERSFGALHKASTRWQDGTLVADGGQQVDR